MTDSASAVGVTERRGRKDHSHEWWVSKAIWIVGKRLCDLVIGVPVYTMEMHCASCEVRTEFIYVMYEYKKVDRLCGPVVRVPVSITEM
jgi:hypothetical protein